MIISQRYGFCFFHNPKVGGTSVRSTLERFNDIGFGLWGADPAQTGGRQVDRAHLGVDEFAGLYPELWDRVRGMRRFALCRDPQQRFFSSVAEHSKLHGAIDTRFAAPEQRRRAILEMVDRLGRLGRAEALMDDYELTHFRPQWIYWTSAEPGIGVETRPLADIAEFFAAIEALVGEPLQVDRVKQRENLALPGPLAGLASNRLVKRMAGVLPGGSGVKALMRRRYARESKGDGFDLPAVDRTAIAAFIRGFYAEDYARWADAGAAVAKMSS